MKMRFYQCAVCGQVVLIVEETGVPLICCGEEMKEIVPGSVDASLEKHVPVIETNGDTVTVKIGSAPHPMAKEHYIDWVMLQTKDGVQYKALSPEQDANVCFRLCGDDAALDAYAYCNLHGLWRGEADR